MGDSIYSFGGKVTTPPHNLATDAVYRYDLANNVWTSISSMINKRFSMSLIPLSDKEIFITGRASNWLRWFQSICTSMYKLKGFWGQSLGPISCLHWATLFDLGRDWSTEALTNPLKSVLELKNWLSSSCMPSVIVIELAFPSCHQWLTKTWWSSKVWLSPRWLPQWKKFQLHRDLQYWDILLNRWSRNAWKVIQPLWNSKEEDKSNLLCWGKRHCGELHGHWNPNLRHGHSDIFINFWSNVGGKSQLCMHGLGRGKPLDCGRWASSGMGIHRFCGDPWPNNGNMDQRHGNAEYRQCVGSWPSYVCLEESRSSSIWAEEQSMAWNKRCANSSSFPEARISEHSFKYGKLLPFPLNRFWFLSSFVHERAFYKILRLLGHQMCLSATSFFFSLFFFLFFYEWTNIQEQLL